MAAARVVSGAVVVAGTDVGVVVGEVATVDSVVDVSAAPPPASTSSSLPHAASAAPTATARTTALIPELRHIAPPRTPPTSLRRRPVAQGAF